MAERAGIAPRRERQATPRLAAIPFDAERQLMATVHAGPDGGTILYVKGAPETLLGRCAGGSAEAARHEVERARRPRRARVALRRRDGVGPEPEAIDAALNHLQLVGLQAMIDPPRDEAREAIAACHAAGIRVLMITGDHPSTARSIGAQLGLEDRAALTGAELDRLDDARLRQAVQQTDVYARVEPEHKLRLVRALQRRPRRGGHDRRRRQRRARPPARPTSASPWARAARRPPATRPTWCSPTTTSPPSRAAIEEGRRVYDNLVKALTFVLPTSVGQALIIAVAVLAVPFSAGEPVLPVSPVQILWINLIVAVALALPLALEAPEPGLMDRPPRDPSASLLDRPLLVRTLAVSAMLTAVALGLFELEHTRQLDTGVSDQLATARGQDHRGDRRRALPGHLPAQLPLARPQQPRDRAVLQPLGLRRHRHRPRPPSRLHPPPRHAHHLRLGDDRPDRARLRRPRSPARTARHRRRRALAQAPRLTPAHHATIITITVASFA